MVFPSVNAYGVLNYQKSQLYKASFVAILICKVDFGRHQLDCDYNDLLFSGIGLSGLQYISWSDMSSFVSVAKQNAKVWVNHEIHLLVIP